MKRTFLSMSLGLAVLTGPTVIGQEAETPRKTKKERIAAVAPSQPERSAAAAAVPGRKQLSPFNMASSFVGAVVHSGDGKVIGKVHDLVFDLDKGELAYAVISLDGANGQERQVAVPTRALKPAEGANHLVLNMSESVLAAAEGLQEGEWPGTDIFAVGAPGGAESGTASSDSEQK